MLLFSSHIDACYRSGGQEVSRNLVQWMKKGVKIPYTGLPRDIQDGVTGILLKSIRYKEMIRKIITGIPS